MSSEEKTEIILCLNRNQPQYIQRYRIWQWKKKSSERLNYETTQDDKKRKKK